jgi:uncharacterized protein with PIN domain
LKREQLSPLAKRRVQEPAVKFIADAMLGRLARWLRLMGFDTLYFADIDDRELLKLALKEQRVILTRDTAFPKRDIGDLILIKSDDPYEQLEQVIREVRPETPREMRCANCNGTLSEVQRKEEVADSVPEFVYLNHSHFLRCTGCGNVYWEGSQYRKLKEKMNEILNLSEGGNS